MSVYKKAAPSLYFADRHWGCSLYLAGSLQLLTACFDRRDERAVFNYKSMWFSLLNLGPTLQKKDSSRLPLQPIGRARSHSLGAEGSIYPFHAMLTFLCQNRCWFSIPGGCLCCSMHKTNKKPGGLSWMVPMWAMVHSASIVLGFVYSKKARRCIQPDSHWSVCPSTSWLPLLKSLTH